MLTRYHRSVKDAFLSHHAEVRHTKKWRCDRTNYITKYVSEILKIGVAVVDDVYELRCSSKEISFWCVGCGAAENISDRLTWRSEY